ncbi:MAG: hypothetical protein GWM90_20030 [Gemmatimonadetes bacterium]|nr:hypothetical protein [Gemmatimonadota bacterium]NIQ56731.1 hypothetical protein [Gemmatimonadota bacterium]NIU76918.1 hypothetical protein [Gammaproteobacteria bacterium]NIX46289.1 hypothetical protein [Gemmatimonadota bacterium]NIY10615.1 hypothetical protein [Gemmatimonadota bacterium]
MFREFKRAWRQAVENFWAELEAGEAGTASGGAYAEIARVRNQMDALDGEIGDCRQAIAHERDQLEACVRRERMATDIGDAETARIAAEYGARHRERADVLNRKLDALEAERGLCRRDLDEMERALQEGRVRDPAVPELEDLNAHPQEHEFRDLEETDRARSAEERLEELKRRMGR